VSVNIHYISIPFRGYAKIAYQIFIEEEKQIYKVPNIAANNKPVNSQNTPTTPTIATLYFNFVDWNQTKGIETAILDLKP
jgi:hypothetical protein